MASWRIDHWQSQPQVVFSQGKPLSWLEQKSLAHHMVQVAQSYDQQFGSGWNSQRWCFGGKSQWTSLNLVCIMRDCFIQRFKLIYCIGCINTFNVFILLFIQFCKMGYMTIRRWNEIVQDWHLFFTGVTSVGLLSSRSNGASGTFFSFEARVIMVIFCNITITSSGDIVENKRVNKADQRMYYLFIMGSKSDIR